MRILFLCAVVLGISVNVFATKYYVSKTGSGIPPYDTWETACKYPQQAIDFAYSNGGGVVWVSSGIYKPNDADPSNLDRGQSFQMRNGVTIRGSSSVIFSGDIGKEGFINDNCFHVFNHSEALDETAVLDGVTVTQGCSDGGIFPQQSGGGMRNQSASPTVRNCVFQKNFAALYGGAVYNHSASPSFTNCSFEKNSSNLSGAGVYNWHSSPTIDHCGFTGNNAKNSGGGIYNEESSPPITYCVFSQNECFEWGGAICNRSSSSSISYCEFTQNAALNGGAVYNQFSPVTVKGCAFSENHNHELKDPYSYGYGGGIDNAQSSPLIINCSFSKNQVQALQFTLGRCFGAGINNENGSNPTIVNCTFSGNSAHRAGGGVSFTGDSSNSLLVNCIFWNNKIDSSDYQGYAQINYNAAPPKVLNCIVQGNFPSGQAILDKDPLLRPFGDYGGSVSSFAINSGSSAFNSGIIVYRDAKGAAYYNWNKHEHLVPVDGSSIPVEPITCLNDEDTRGVARPLQGFVDIGAYEYGASYKTIKDGVWSDLSIWQMNDGDTWSTPKVNPNWRSAANIYVNHNITLDIDGVTVFGMTIGSTATLNIEGGRILVISDGPSTDLVVLGSLVSQAPVSCDPGSTTAYSGGNQSVAGGNYHDLILNGSGDKTLAGPIGVAGTLTINDCVFRHNNKKVTYNGENQIVKALDYYSLALTGESSIKTLEAGVTSVNSPIELNEGITLTGASGPATIQAVGSYGFQPFIIDANGKTVRFENFSIKGNGLEVTIGGCVLIRRGTLAIESSTLSQGHANMGGAVAVATGSLTMNNCTLTGNTANSGGGILCYGGATATINNTTISGNSGGGLHNLSSTATLVNCVLWNNGDGKEITSGSSTWAPSANNCVIHGGYLSGTNIVNSDPRLLALADNGGPVPTMAIPWDSSARDSGDTSKASPKDARGLSRVGEADIGAYENQKMLVTFRQGDHGAIEGAAFDGTLRFGVDTGAAPSSPNVTANLNYEFTGWQPELPETVTEYIDVTAQYRLKSYTVTFTATIGGTLSGATSQTVVYGGEYTPVTAIPDATYRFVNWTKDGMGISNLTSLTPTGISENTNYTANFTMKSTAIITSATSGGTITPSSAPEEGTNFTVNITPDEGHHILDVRVDNVSVGAVSSYVFNNVTGVHTVDAVFELNQFTITTSVGPNGTITPSTTVPYGTNFTVKITPDAYFKIQSVKVNGQYSAPVENCTLFVNRSYTVEATFTASSYMITTEAGENGTITPSQRVFGGSDFHVIITPNQGYQILGVLIDGKAISHHYVPSGALNYMFRKVNSPHKISATFGKGSYHVSFASVPGGMIMGDIIQTVDHGESCAKVVAVPDKGYTFLGWELNDKIVFEGHELTVSDVLESLLYLAIFVRNEYEVNFTAAAGGEIVGDIAQTVIYNESSSSVMAKAHDGYSFVCWKRDDGKYLYDNPLIIENVLGDMNVSAIFQYKVASDFVFELPLASFDDQNGILSRLPEIYVMINGHKKRVKIITNRKELESVSTTLSCLWRHRGVPAGEYSLWVKLKGEKRNEKLKAINEHFTVMEPSVDIVYPTSGSSGDTIIVTGSYFGSKPPMVFFSLPNRDKNTIVRVGVDKPYAYSNYRGTLGKSVMDPYSGESLFSFQVPKSIEVGEETTLTIKFPTKSFEYTFTPD